MYIYYTYCVHIFINKMTVRYSRIFNVDASYSVVNSVIPEYGNHGRIISYDKIFRNRHFTTKRE